MASQTEKDLAQILIDIRNSGRPKRTISGNTLTIANGTTTISLDMFNNNVQSDRVAVLR